MTTEQRLQRLEDEFEVVKDLLTSTARYAESANRGLDQVVGAIERLTESQAASQAALDERFRQVSETQIASQAALDAQLGQLGRSQAETERQLGQISEAQAATERQIERLFEAQAATERQLERTSLAQAATEAQLERTSLAQAATEAQLERTSLAQAATEAQLERTNQRLDEFIFQVQRLLSRDAERLDIVEGRIERLEAIAQRLDRNYEAQQSQFQEFQLTTRASQERQERLLEYLLRRDGETR
jgi:chromosome segregation ATPase